MVTLKTKSISQHKLRRLAELMKYGKELVLLNAELKEMYADRIMVQPGRYDLAPKVNKGKRTPKWKDECIKSHRLRLMDSGVEVEDATLLATQHAEKIISKTELGKDSTSVILVDKNAV